MRAYHAAFLAWAIVLGTSSLARSEDNVGWGSTIPAAQTQAAESGRLVLVHFWSPSCKPCMRLEQDVFSMPNVGRAIRADYVPVKINADFSPTTAVQYGVTSLPTDVILTPTGQMISKFNSPLNSTQYTEQLHQVATNAKAGAPVASAAPAAAPAATVQWNAPPAAQGAVTPTAAAQPVASSFPPATSNAPLFTGGASAYPAGSTTAATAPAAAAGAPATGSPYSNDRYADYLRQRTAQAPAGTVAAVPQGPAVPWGQPPVASQQVAANQAAPASQPVAPAAGAAMQLPPGNPPLGLDGYCPVRLREEYKWVLGDRRFGVIHRGRTYLFTGEAERQKFLANPDLYSPVMAGNDPVIAFEQGQGIAGQRKLGVFYGEGPAARVYMFSSEDSLKRFWENPERYATEIRQAETAGRGVVR